MNVARGPSLGIAVLAAAALILPARDAIAGEAIDWRDIRLELPAGFRRGDPESESQIRVDAKANFGRGGPNAFETETLDCRLYGREGLDVVDRVVILTVSGRMYPASEPDFLEGTRLGLVNTAKAMGGTVAMFGLARTPSGLEYIGSRVEAPDAAGGPLTIRSAMVPRDGRLVLLSLTTVGKGGATNETWEAVLASLRTNLGAPSADRASGSPAYRAGRIIGMGFLGILLIVVVSRFLRRRRAPPPPRRTSRERAAAAGANLEGGDARAPDPGKTE